MAYQIPGSAGNDALHDFSGDFGSGSTILNSNWSLGEDQMWGYAGDDTYFVNSAGDQVHESPGGGIDTVQSRRAGYTLPDNVENLLVMPTADIDGWQNGFGNALDNEIIGNTRSNWLRGHGGNDWVYGGGGHDNLDGGSGADNLFGGDGSDRLMGEGGADYLVGGSGDDTLFGGTGADTLKGGSGNDTSYGGTGADQLWGGGGFDRMLVGSENQGSSADAWLDYSAAEDTIVLADSMDGVLDLGVTGLSFVGAPLAASHFFKWNGADGGGQGNAPSGIYVDTVAGGVWYNPTSANGDNVQIGWVDPATAQTLTADDFVYDSLWV